jgi:DNA (cytosine-5)-methyltransferase 1
VLDLFSGCGGMSQGFRDAGYDVVLGVDNDSPSLDTFRRNFGERKALSLDLSTSTANKQIERAFEKFVKKIDVIVAGPPCQGFSLTGPRQLGDPRNELYMSVFKAVRYFEPQAFLIENVKGMGTLYGGAVLSEIVKKFRRLGYQVPDPRVLLAANYGVPQMRERLFIMGVRKADGIVGYPPTFFDENSYITCEEAIGNLPSRESDLGIEIDAHQAPPTSEYQIYMQTDAKWLYNHVATRHTDHVISVIKQVPEGMNHKALPPGVGDSRKFNEAWTRYHSKRPSRTIDTGHRNHFHYKWNRVPTVRENARLQSFRDTFFFCGPRTQQQRQVGNAVPPLLAYQFAQLFEKYLK